MSSEIETPDGKIVVIQKIMVTATVPLTNDSQEEHHDKALAAVATHLGRAPIELEYKSQGFFGGEVRYTWEMDAESIYPKESAFGPSPAEKLSVR